MNTQTKTKRAQSKINYDGCMAITTKGHQCKCKRFNNIYCKQHIKKLPTKRFKTKEEKQKIRKKLAIEKIRDFNLAKIEFMWCDFYRGIENRNGKQVYIYYHPDTSYLKEWHEVKDVIFEIEYKKVVCDLMSEIKKDELLKAKKDFYDRACSFTSKPIPPRPKRRPPLTPPRAKLMKAINEFVFDELKPVESNNIENKISRFTSIPLRNGSVAVATTFVGNLTRSPFSGNIAGFPIDLSTCFPSSPDDNLIITGTFSGCFNGTVTRVTAVT